MNSEDKFKLSRSTSSVDVVLHSVTGRVCVLILLDTIWQNRVGSVLWGGLALRWWWVNSGPLENNCVNFCLVFHSTGVPRLIRISLLRFFKKKSLNLPYANFGLLYFISAIFLAIFAPKICKRQKLG